MINNIRIFIREEAERFGARGDTDLNKSYVERNNTGDEALKDNGGYFGFIHYDEGTSGPFHDFSLTIFPNKEKNPWLVCLGVGSSGFKDDYELANNPGLRRLFSKIINEKGFCNSDFSDIETSLPKSLTNLPELNHIKNTVKTYNKVLPAVQIVDEPGSEAGKKIISAFVAAYAKLREWPSNQKHRDAVSLALAHFSKADVANEEDEVSSLLKKRKYVILQGPPGTGKTRLAKNIAKKLDAKTFFTQFHAETAYSDFIYGIRPDVAEKNLFYLGYPGIFAQAVTFAIKYPKETVMLIIDEINRANLSNVLGPLFYLFEYKPDESNV